MPSFKPKTNKKIIISKNTNVTLDGKHNEVLKEFNENQKYFIPKLNKEISFLNKELLNMEMPIEKKMDYQDRNKQLKEEIKKIKKKEKEYLLNNSKYIFEYFENKKNISNTNIDSEKSCSKNKALDNFFKIKTNDVETPLNNDLSIVKKYLSNLDDSFLDMSQFVRPTDVCQFCNKGELIPLEDEGTLTCNLCGVHIPFLIENDKPSYKEPPKEVCFYAYKKINHFKEILSQYQGKETTNISLDIIDQIKLQIKKERIELSHLTHYKTKEILKKLGLNKYYEHIVFIKNKLGIKPPVMSQELEDTLCNLFMELQSPYSKNCPDYRVNFLNYYYVLFKLCELLGEDKFLSEIPMLKDREKLIEQDEIWKKMCEELDWEFIPTV